ncbi:hypothetical protein WR25_05490 [Diploscapter pachys]|uniref:Dynein assembly factor 1, axonemal homolog n=1 Tax=Diploscapter pachys TaxID=2018661 RepID=A0A2A2LXJ9_9BILA|nr:hypothetical protein WR25_05490 [Diploscapter pachys]
MVDFRYWVTGQGREIHSIADDLAVRLGQLGDGWLESSDVSPKYFEFTPIEMHALTQRLKLPGPTCPDQKMIADIGNAVSFLNRVKALKVRGQKGYVGTSNIVWNSVEYSIALCKNLMALWLADTDVCRLEGLDKIKGTIRRLVVHYSMRRFKDLLVPEDNCIPVTQMEKWPLIEKIDCSFNRIEEIDESVHVLAKAQYLNLSHNSITEIGPNLQHLSGLVELDLSANCITELKSWNEKLGNLKKLTLAENSIRDLSGLSKLYSLEYLDVRGNDIEEIESIAPIGRLPCLETLLLRDNPVRKVLDYRIRVLESFKERCGEVKLDSKKADGKELDTINVRLALRRAKEEKEARELRKKQKIQEKINYLSGDDNLGSGKSRSNSNSTTSEPTTTQSN